MSLDLISSVRLIVILCTDGHSRRLGRNWTCSLRMTVSSTTWVPHHPSINRLNPGAYIQDHVLYDQFNGIVLDPLEGQNIAQTLGPKKKAVILQNHGLITCSNTIEGAVHLFIRLEECCRCQLLGYSSGSVRLICE